ncbi:MAG: response regulator, partial [Longimicrobiales bacterium]|nr:response regulator [Longimicrobiales bacterium]
MSTSRGPTLLVVEDMQDQAILVGIAARRAHPGLDVRSAGNGNEGIAYLKGVVEGSRDHPRPDLVILDLYMPEADGFVVLEWLKERGGQLDLPVVILTSSPSVQDEIRALETGAKAVYKKPEHVTELG